MTLPRSELVDLDKTPFYHCMVRCVRQSFLCGVNKETGQDFSHRKQWIEERILQLASIFAIKICAYAVMTNHYHVVVFINEKQADAWSDQEIIKRWKALCPKDAKKGIASHLSEKSIKEKIAIWRERLTNLSWFMRFLNEPIARLSNKEDNCTGHFWQGRFKSQAILDEGALLSTMAYVDLNPIRAKIAQTPEESEFTSIYERIKVVAKAMIKSPKKEIDDTKQAAHLMSFANGKNQDSESIINFRLSDYIELIDTTGRIIREDKKGAIPKNLDPILSRLNLTSHGWLKMVNDLEKDFYHAIGCESKLLSFPKCPQRGPKGISAAKYYYSNVA